MKYLEDVFLINIILEIFYFRKTKLLAMKLNGPLLKVNSTKSKLIAFICILVIIWTLAKNETPNDMMYAV
jgi:hypothetical protein